MRAHAVEYMRFRCLGNPCVLISSVMIGTLRGLKDAKMPLYAALLANVVHLVLDLVLVYGLGMGAGGVAASTALSQALGCGLLFYTLVRRCVRHRCLLFICRVHSFTAGRATCAQRRSTFHRAGDDE